MSPPAIRTLILVPGAGCGGEGRSPDTARSTRIPRHATRSSRSTAAAP
eukprot:CAMPEP_0194313856 /NCGR_PEP_ID=MMETSP0171-20130528/10702_1 /TAXON_ID=218684 /ORGANISM="Corethron pennatum, Strain L29A3" /LENGTH=47 /DNA_ID= /DNA_START= /DNA_END= /DNA_ORIENTATION=